MTKTYPNCSLRLSFEGITLSAFSDGAWKDVRTIPLDPEQLERDMAQLLAQARSQFDDGHKVRLIIADEQIKYIAFDIKPSATQDEILGDIETRLVIETPYRLSEIRYDHQVINGKVFAAAIAIETLHEAENFASDHGFEPVGCVAEPTADISPFSPYFGLASFPEGRMLVAPPPPVTSPPTPDTPPAPPEIEIGDDAPIALATQRPTAPVVTAPDLGAVAPTIEDVAVPPKSHRPIPKNLIPPKPPQKSEQDLMSAFGILADQADKLKQDTSEKSTPIAWRSAAILTAVFVVIVGLVFYLFSGSDTDPVAQSAAPGIDSLEIEAQQLETVENTEPLQPVANPTENDIASLPQETNTPEPDETAVVVVPQPELSVIETTPDSTISTDASTDVTDVQTPTEPDPIRTTYSTRDIQRIYTAMGVWPVGPERDPPKQPEPLGDVYIASIDPRFDLQDAIALPSTQSLQTDQSIRKPVAPAPAGTVFEFNAQGLVIPTPDGALTPDGILVFAGKPAVTPPQSPFAQSEDSTVLGETTSFLTPSGTPLIDLRPRTRPGSLFGSETDPAAQSNPLALVRPRNRPQEFVALTPEPEPSVPSADAIPSPKRRPSDLKTTILDHEEAEGAEAEVTAVVPNIPSNVKVSQEATIQNALKLNQINLIGVFGSGNQKRALVRFPNGKRQMVSVGDGLDGGKVAAIGDTELRYVKSGRNVVLKLPRG